MPSILMAFIVLVVSSALRKFLKTLFPLDKEEKIKALWDIDLSGGGEIVPLRLFALLSSILFNTFPQCPGLLNIPFKGFGIFSPEILANPVEVVLKELNGFED